MTDRPTLSTAKTAKAILEAVARREWWEDHLEECPDYMIPTCADLADAGLIVMISGRGAATFQPPPSARLTGPAPESKPEPPTPPDPPDPPTPAAVAVAAYVESAHNAWKATAPRPAMHPLTEKVRAWWGLPKRVDRNTQPTRIMPGTMAVVPGDHPRAGHLFMPHGAGRAGEGMPLFPGLDDGENYSRPRLPIHLHRLGLDQQHGTGAPVAERMWVEALLSAANQTPNRPEKYSVTFRDFMHALWPGQHLRPTEWLPRVEAAAEALSRREARIAWEDPATGYGGLRQVVAVTDIPRTPDKLDDLVTVTVDLPPGSRAGPLMPKNLLAWGARSHLAFVGLINLGFNWFDPGVLRVPAQRGTHWLQVQDPTRYPDLTPDDLLELFMPHRDWMQGGQVKWDALHNVRKIIRLLEVAHGLRCETGTQRGSVKLLPPPPDAELQPPTKRARIATKRARIATKRARQGKLNL